MLYIFKSRASADVIMFGQDAKRLLEIMGKDTDPKGILTVDQLPGAIARLKKAAEEDRTRVRAHRDHLDASNDHRGIEEDKTTVHLSQRAVPLLDMMEASLKEDTPVVWGV
ncbi:MAG: DUF1840 domain-containing protein [Rhodocyclaceae bacterium]|nr:DUF1840 domain-containing protein [Rhodocyclaceae bacterium]